MHLASLELFGFKSFAEKTVLHFHEGVTAIVGPNGCGKSNVLDAIRWVLGEQSAKALRGGEMADVIFSGTDSRKAVGMAEVSLTFADCAAELGVDWHEVRVTRRVYRDGQSEYLLNKTACRLRDIHNLFADTGVGRSAYSIMEQGKIDLILSSRPEDRRTVFEEAAGITKYKGQKREALRKLEATEANLLRLGDIMKEVRRQIGSLQRQAGKARRYQATMADLQVLDTHHARRQLAELETATDESRREIIRLDEQLRDTEAGIETRENSLGEQRRTLDEIDRRMNDARAEVQRLQNQIAGHRNRIEFNRERAQELTSLIERYQNDIAAAESKREQQETQIHETELLLQETDRLLASKQTELSEQTDRAARLRAERGDRERELRDLETALSKAETRIASLQNELQDLESRRQTTSMRQDDLAAELSEAQGARDRIAGQLEEVRAAAEAQQKNVEALLAQSREAEEILRQKQDALRESETSLIASERALTEKESKLEILRQLNEEGEGLTKGSKAVLKGLDDPARIRPALGGALVSQLEVEREFIAAVEAALGRNLQAIILQNGDLAASIIATLTEKKLGQTALIVPELAPEKAKASNAALPEGALGWAIEKVNAPEPLQALVAHLLGDVVLARDLPSALVMKAGARDLRFATLAGEFISCEGVVSGGSTSENRNSMLERKAQIASLAREQTQLAAQRDAALLARETARDAVEHATGQARAAREQHQAADRAQTDSAARIAELQRNLHDSQRKVDGLTWESETLTEQLASAAARVAQLENERALQRAILQENEAKRDAAQQTWERAREHEEEAADALNDLRLAVATERQRHDNLISQRQPMAARQTELAELIAARRMDIGSYENRLRRQAEESSLAEAAIESDCAQCEAAEVRVTEISAQRATQLAAANALEMELRSARKSVTEIHEARGKHEVRQTQWQLRIDSLAEHISRRYQLNLRELAADHYAFAKTLKAQVKRREKSASAGPESEESQPTVIEADAVAAPTESEEINWAEVEQIIAELTRQIDAMGPVNLDAVHEYDELEQRQSFLEKQNSDLTEARRELLDVIARINETTQKLFAETFAQVRINFREMFDQLFGGGRADLALQDENDPLECGIEITAKPPGKQLQSISLLSGGERTMTAVALLFAIYMVRPSPFCVLDEMDAPLDESNINRFIKMLDRFVAQSQFVIITHNKRTIAKAEVIYGVTMEERGVSRLVGMKLSAAPNEDRAGKPPASATAAEGRTIESPRAVEHEENLALSI